MKKFDRISLDDITFGSLLDIFLDAKYLCFFVVFDDRKGVIRYKIPKITSEEDLLRFIDYGYKVSESGINSDHYNIFTGNYIDCYYKV